jgi:5-methylcytosine-specific restriction enzyme subunit McrC
MTGAVDSIPIRNLYFLLLYAWDRLDAAAQVPVSGEDETSLRNLLARVLEFGARRLLLRGLDRDYLRHREDIRGIRGRVNFAESIQRNLLPNGLARCEFDELSYNVLHNRILKTTIARLTRDSALDSALREKLAKLDRRLREIDPLELSPGIFSRVTLHRNNAGCRFLMNICEFIHRNAMIAEADAGKVFQDFSRDQMAALFEAFLRNFYRIELEGVFPGYRVVGGETIHWDTGEMDGESRKRLPVMKTDISMRTPSGYLIIDAKYYKETMAGQFGKKVHSGHLYQLFAYLRNIAARGPEFKNAAGLLLYPAVRESVQLDYEIQGHRISVRTVDLAQDWREIHDELLAAVGVESDDGATSFGGILAAGHV